MNQVSFFRSWRFACRANFVFGALCALSVGVPVWAAESAGSPPSEAVRVVALATSPLVAKTPQGERSVLVATIESRGLANVTVRLASPDWPDEKPMTVIAKLPAGKGQAEWEVPLVTKAAEVTVGVELQSGTKEFGPFTVRPARQWTVYLTQHTHTDIGYTRPQTEILPEHLRYIDYALDYCDLTDQYPDDARFRWTCETSWAVREYVKRRPPQQIERLKRRLQEGRIEITGMLLNMAEIATESSLAASLEPLRTLKTDFGITPRTTMQDDVNGAAWCLVDYFQDIGIKYLSMGINKTRSILPFDKPTAFWWESPSGKRLLAYRSDHYMTANFWHINDNKLETFRPEVAKYLKSLEDRHYPFDRIGVQFSGYYTDNSPPSTVGCEVVKAWNEKYAWPKLRLSTAQEFLSYVEKEHGQELEVHRQAWPDWWTDGFGSAARETAAARETETAVQVSQGLLSIASILGAQIKPGVLSGIRAIQENLLFYAEHTYGAAESISDPLAENTQVQWGEKGSYAWEAVKHSSLLREEAFGLVQPYLPRADRPTIAIFNTLNWKRSGLVTVFIDHEMLDPNKEFRIVDASTGTTIPAQAMNRRAEGTYWALWVKDVPSLGYRILRIESGKQPRSAPPTLSPQAALDNRFYALKLDTDKGALKSLVDKETGQELVDSNASWGLGQCIYETLSGGRDMKRDRFKRTSVRRVKLLAGANGPIWKSLRFSADLEGCATNNGVNAEIRLYETEKRVEFHFDMRKLPVLSPEAVYVAFPFRCPNGKMLYEAQGGCVVPGEDQLPGSSSDWQTLQSFLSVRNDAQQVVWGSEQVPLVQLGDLNLGKWQPITQVEHPYVYSWVMNNYWFTNFRAEQEGQLRWHYYFTSSRDTSRTFATRFGWGSRIPLAPRVLPPGKSPSPDLPLSLSALSVNVPNVLLVETKPALASDGILLHWREIEGKPVTIEAGDVESSAAIDGADEVNVLEEVVRGGIEGQSFAPYETKFDVLRFQPK